MNWLEALVLGAIQGVTEFLPISSSGHLALVEHLFARLHGATMSGPDSLFFNVMLHLGTLVAILAYYRAVVRDGAAGLLGSKSVAPEYERSRLVRVCALAVIATIPAAFIGKFFKHEIEAATANPMVTGLGFLVTAAVLGFTARLGSGTKDPELTTWRDALLIGCAQAFAILPGVSRSGSTIATALMLGLSRTWAVGFSLLMAIPAILGAAVLELKEVDPRTLTALDPAMILSATIVSGLVGYSAIIGLVRIVRRGKLWYFSVYLAILAVVVLASLRVSDPGRAHGESTYASDRAAVPAP